MRGEIDIPTPIDLSVVDGCRLDGLEFCSRAYRLFDESRSYPAGRTRRLLLPKHGPEKRLLEEVLPIATFLRNRYRPGRYFDVCWKDGNGPVDAELFLRTDPVLQDWRPFDEPTKSFIEVTSAAHENEYESRRLTANRILNSGPLSVNKQKGKPTEVGIPCLDNYKMEEDFARVVAERILKKAGKRYPDQTRLLVDLNKPGVIVEGDTWSEFMAALRKLLPEELPFLEVCLVDWHSCGLTEVWSIYTRKPVD